MPSQDSITNAMGDATDYVARHPVAAKDWAHFVHAHTGAALEGLEAEAKMHPEDAEALAIWIARHPTAVRSWGRFMNEPINYDGFLNPKDGVAISFWIISIAMVASTVFFLMESRAVSYHWKTSMNVGALVTLVAAVHYFYMREYWVKLHASPIVYRYIDWSITVPLQMVEFYLILSAVKPDISSFMFWRLLIGTVIMLLFGYLGESGSVAPSFGFYVGMAGWAFILFEIFFGEAGGVAADKVSVHVQKAFGLMRFIVTVGWSIYPLGYFFGFLNGAVSDTALNLIYNLADFVNKIAFCLAIWASAKTDTLEKEGAC